LLDEDVDGIAHLLGEFTRQFEHRTSTFLVGEVAPVLGDLTLRLLVNVALTGGVPADTVLLRIRSCRVIARLTAGRLTTAGSGSPIASGPSLFLLLLLVLLLLDHLLETNEDFLLHLARLFAAAVDFQTIGDDVHLAR